MPRELPFTVYILFGGNNWKEIFILCLVFPVIALLFSFFIPESPRYLYLNRDLKELKRNLCIISKINGVNPEDLKYFFLNRLFRIDFEEIYKRDFEDKRSMILWCSISFTFNNIFFLFNSK